MKKVILLLNLSVIFCMFFACNDDDKVINESELPTVAKTFLDTYFSEQSVLDTRKDNDEYEVYYANYKVEFDIQGIWKQADGKQMKGDYRSVPQGFLNEEIPTGIITWITQYYPNISIVEVEKEYENGVHVGYDVELSSGVELDFDAEGNLTGSGGTSTIELPKTAKDFMNIHFSRLAYTTIRDENEYDVYANAYKIEFDLQGNWIMIDGHVGSVKTALPESLLLLTPVSIINNYVIENYPGRYIIEIEKDHENGKLYYDIEIDNQLDLVFDTEGQFVKRD